MKIFRTFFKEEVNTITVNDNFSITNFWSLRDPQELWFYQFLKHRNLLNHEVTYNFISVFGDKPKLNKKHLNIFFSGENTSLRVYKKYKNHLLESVDMALGFDYIDHPNYLRFPLWILYIIPPNASFEDVQNVFDNSKLPSPLNRSIGFSLIASHDRNGIRKKIISVIHKNLSPVVCAGKFRNNSHLLKEKYNDNKLLFLKDVQFNICPENSNNEGYVTEKLFEAISAGCIPIYWGAKGNPEPLILNRKNIILFDEMNPLKMVKDIRDVDRNNSIQAMYTPNAASIVWDWLNRFEHLVRQKIAEKS